MHTGVALVTGEGSKTHTLQQQTERERESERERERGRGRGRGRERERLLNVENLSSKKGLFQGQPRGLAIRSMWPSCYLSMVGCLHDALLKGERG